MKVEHAFANGETEPEPAEAAGHVATALFEGFKNSWQQDVLNPDAAVAHDDLYLVRDRVAGRDFDPSTRDSMFEEAARVIVTHQQGSTSLLQRRLKLGYNRAGRLIDQLEHAGIVGPFEGSKAREVLIPDEYSLEQLLNSLPK